MSAQINLYHARFLNVRDWLHLNYVALAAAIVFFLLGIWTVIAQRELHQTQTKAAALLNTLETTKAAVEEATQRTNQPANPQLLAEIAHAQATLSRRDEIVHLLESGAVGNSQGFSTFLSGFARQVPTGLWLTGFTLSSGGANMEIRGSTYDEKTVPEYIRRLGRETLFQGRQFSALLAARHKR
ncbi:MAG: PilN domain-containing protein [Rugosibacter sp.]|nr:PilN domain-containing protein [Rugosibacter sp.]